MLRFTKATGMGSVIRKIISSKVLLAHCDIPCGIYDPHTAQIAALTCVRMNQLIAALEDSAANGDKLSRYIATKEHHAEQCKQELRIIWADYFKPEHLEAHPNVHQLFWEALKLGSKVRQNVDLDAAEQLLEKTRELAEIFWSTKGVSVKRQASNQTGGGELVYPV